MSSNICPNADVGRLSTGLSLLFQLLLVLLHFWSFSYSSYYFFGAKTTVHGKLRLLTILCHIFGTFLVCVSLIHTIGSGTHWWLYQTWWCQIIIFFLVAPTGAAYCCINLVWLERLALVFQDSAYAVSTRTLRILYATAIIGFLIILGLDGWLAASAGCVKPYKTRDFDIPYFSKEENDETIHWTCRISSLPAGISIGFDALVICASTIITGYMYISRMIYTGRSVQHSAEGLTKVTSRSSISDANPRISRVISIETRQVLLHTRKYIIIALTSVLSTILTVIITTATGYMQFIELDIVFHEILILCGFTFGQRLYNLLFGCCNKCMEDQLAILL